MQGHWYKGHIHNWEYRLISILEDGMYIYVSGAGDILAIKVYIYIERSERV